MQRQYWISIVTIVVIIAAFSVVSVYLEANKPSSSSYTHTSTTKTSTTSSSALTATTYPQYSFSFYGSATVGTIVNSIITLPYPTTSYGSLSGSDAQPNPDTPSNYTGGFGFTGLFDGCAIGAICSNYTLNNMAVWLHENKSSYNYPEFGFTYRLAGSCYNGTPGVQAAVFGYVQWGNGNSSETIEHCVLVQNGTNTWSNYSVTVNSTTANWTTGSCLFIQCYENVFSFYVNGTLAGSYSNPPPAGPPSDCGNLCYAYFDYESTLWYFHAATHLYPEGSTECSDCFLRLSATISNQT